MEERREYLGDGVYARLRNDGTIILRVNDPEDENLIVLEPETWQSLLVFVACGVSQVSDVVNP